MELRSSTMWRRLLVVVAAIAVAIGVALPMGISGAQKAWGDTGTTDLGEPVHTKTLTANGDGAYTLTLDVTGKSQASQEKTKANVIVVLDTSGSMGFKTDSFVYKEANDNSHGPRYGLVGDNYVKLEWYNGGWWYESGYRWKQYSGTVYVREYGESTRLAAAKSAVNDLANALLSLNEEGEGTVQMALVTFANVAGVQTFSDGSWTTDYSSFSSRVNNLGAYGGTNWEDALAEANAIVGDGDPTYIIFVSDGNPTRYVNDYGNTAGSGDETDNNVATCYNEAKDDARAIVTSGKSFYAIGAFGDVDRMQSLVTYAYTNNAPANHYFSATDHEGLESAFASIIDDIEKNFTYTDVTITDKVTGLTATGITGNATGFVYEKNGEVWDDAPAASFSGGTLTWNLGDNFKLEDGVTYSVSFKVWPNQEAFDTVAGLTNGAIEWDATKYPNIVKNQDGTYSVYTNESATLKYKQVDTVDGVDTESAEKTATYNRPLMLVPVSTLSVEKIWENTPAGFNKPSIEVVVTQDGEDYKTLSLSPANNWATTLAVAAGPEGHTYGLKEITNLGNGWSTICGDEVEMKGLTALASGFALSLTNAYAAAPAEAAISVQKVLEGRDWKATDSFEFELAAKTAGAPMPAATKVAISNGKPVSFGDITFTKAGVYEYTVTETKGSIGGVTYDETVRTVVVTVTDDGKGQLVASVDYGTPQLNAAVFTNIYGAEKVAVAGFEVTKDLQGRAWADGDSFKFELAAKTAGAPMPNPATATAASAAAVSFGSIEFTEAGVYEYSISEVAGSIPGVTYSTDAFTVIVTVVDDTEGKLVATVDYKNAAGAVVSGASFTNVYEAEAVTVSGFEVTKDLQGREWAEDDSFTAKLTTATEGTPMPEVAEVELTPANKTAAFGGITFTEAGTYTYTVSEEAGDIPGVTYDTTEYTVTVTVTDDGKGKLTASVDYGNAEALKFANTYKAAATSAELFVQKVLNGRDWMNGDEFAFTVKAVTEGAPMPENNKVTVVNGNAASFGAISFTEAGEYVYTISEDKGFLGGILYDEATYTVTVTVTDDGKGQLHAVVDYGVEGATAAVFTNSYGAEKVIVNNIKASKVLEGRAWAAGDSFEFKIAAVTDNAPMPNATTVTATSAAAVNFGSIEYDATGVYKYTISEVEGNIPGIEYDATVYTVTVTVTDDWKGNLQASVAYAIDEKAAQAVVFTNVYDVTPAEASLTVQKTLTGHDMAADQFQFTVKPTDEASAAKLAETSVSNTAAADGNAATMLVGNLSFGLADAGKTFAYEVSEVKGNAAGYTYDSAKHTVEYVVADGGNGTLNVVVKVDGGAVNAAIVEFDNTYRASGQLGGEGNVKIAATKTLEGQAMSSGQFSFDVKDVKGGVVATGTNDAAGAIDFSAIEYTTESVKDDVANGLAVKNEDGTYTYTYQVVENTDGLAEVGITATAANFTISVTLTDDGEGNLIPAVAYPEEASPLAFVNEYGAEDVEIRIAGTKVLAADDGLVPPDIAGKYTFTLTGENAENGLTATNDASGNIAFGSITYTLKDLAEVEAGENNVRTTTFEYTVAETGSVDGVTNDPEVKSFTVTLTDNGKGELTAVASENAAFVFTNTYDVDPVESSVTDKIPLAKTLLGREMVEGEFEFQMADMEGEIVSTGANAADGIVAMSPVKFTEPGTYTYTVSEVEGEAGGVTYDTMVYVVTATVSDNHNGTMSVKWSLVSEGDAIAETEQMTFENTYEAEPVSVIVEAQKTLEGRELAEGEFTFELLDAEGVVVAEAANAADGAVVFEGITFEDAGTYTFEIREVAGDDDTIVYDESVFQVQVVVTDNLQGGLEAKVEFPNGEPVFANEYDEPLPETGGEDPVLPATGDGMGLMARVAAGLACIAAAVCAFALRVARRVN